MCQLWVFKATGITLAGLVPAYHSTHPKGGLLCLKPLLFLFPEGWKARMGLEGVSSLCFWGLLENLGSVDGRPTGPVTPDHSWCSGAGRWNAFSSSLPTALCLSRVAPTSACDPWLRFLFRDFYESLPGAAPDPGSDATSRSRPWTLSGPRPLQPQSPQCPHFWAGPVKGVWATSRSFQRGAVREEGKGTVGGCGY